eukprot:43436-Eustigmatos_ZCMA.PRE.1
MYSLIDTTIPANTLYIPNIVSHRLRNPRGVHARHHESMYLQTGSMYLYTGRTCIDTSLTAASHPCMLLITRSGKCRSDCCCSVQPFHDINQCRHLYHTLRHITLLV